AILRWFAGTGKAPPDLHLLVHHFAAAVGGEQLVQEATLAVANTLAPSSRRDDARALFEEELRGWRDRGEPRTARPPWGLPRGGGRGRAVGARGVARRPSPRHLDPVRAGTTTGLPAEGCHRRPPGAARARPRALGAGAASRRGAVPGASAAAPRGHRPGRARQ